MIRRERCQQGLPMLGIAITPGKRRLMRLLEISITYIISALHEPGNPP
jgi:hypothetical protein